MGEQKQPVIECIVHEWKPFIDAVKHQTGNVCLNCGARVVDGKQPQEGKPLTAEEIEIDHLAFEFACISSEYKFGSDWHKNKVVASMRPYAEVAIKFKNGQTAALREELEEVKTELQYKSENLTDALRQIEHYENRLEVVKQEKDQWQETYQNEHINLLEVTGQRDECKDILIEIKESAITHETTDRAITNLLSRISSGETKPANEWIRVSDRLPELGKAVDIYKEGEDMYYTARIEHRDIEGFFKWNEATHWRFQTPLPAPPESLTDKIKV